jgi:hypothetical protein
MGEMMIKRIILVLLLVSNYTYLYSNDAFSIKENIQFNKYPDIPIYSNDGIFIKNSNSSEISNEFVFSYYIISDKLNNQNIGLGIYSKAYKSSFIGENITTAIIFDANIPNKMSFIGGFGLSHFININIIDKKENLDYLFFKMKYYEYIMFNVECDGLIEGLSAESGSSGSDNGTGGSASLETRISYPDLVPIFIHYKGKLYSIIYNSTLNSNRYYNDYIINSFDIGYGFTNLYISFGFINFINKLRYDYPGLQGNTINIDKNKQYAYGICIESKNLSKYIDVKFNCYVYEKYKIITEIGMNISF